MTTVSSSRSAATGGGGVRLSARTETRATRGLVTIKTGDGTRHGVAPAVTSTAVCVAMLGTSTALAAWLGVPSHQPGRWLSSQQCPSPRSKRMVVDLAYVIARAQQVWGARGCAAGMVAGERPAPRRSTTSRRHRQRRHGERDQSNRRPPRRQLRLTPRRRATARPPAHSNGPTILRVSHKTIR